MLRILSSEKELCDGLSRRDLLQVGGLGVCGLGLDNFLGLKALQAGSADSRIEGSFGKAKNCILLYLYGASSQLETFDMKPDAPVEIRGTMKPIPSVVPGLDVCEHLPHIAGMTNPSTTAPQLVENIRRLQEGLPPLNPVDRIRGY